MTQPHDHQPLRNPRQQLTTRAIIVWLGAALTYMVAITGRTSFGVAAVDAMTRFQVDTAHIAVFTSLQVGVYALVQIPTGMAIDRIGPKKMLVGGAIVMAIGQILLGCATTYPVALIARALIGAGDATAFLTAMRLIPVWFPLRLSPLFAQLTGSLGQVGQFLSAVPFYAILHNVGWSPAFVSLGAVGILIAGAALFMVNDGTIAPTQHTNSQPRLIHVLTHPVVWEGFFMHGAAMVAFTSFMLLWGVPAMTQGMGVDPKTAGLVLVLNPIAMIIVGPLAGLFSARIGLHRDIATIIVTAIMTGTFALFFSAGSPRSLPAAAITVAVVSVFAPSFNFGFDSIREVLPHSVMATGTGFANMGGFLSTMVASQAMGLIMAEPLDWAQFSTGWWAITAVWLICAIGIVITAILLRRRLAARR
ncbi:MAG: MFS transporter [Corynebacterium sp.]|nr:MFS transporter [Corynebacterium sp.]